MAVRVAGGALIRSTPARMASLDRSDRFGEDYHLWEPADRAGHVMVPRGLARFDDDTEDARALGKPHAYELTARPRNPDQDRVWRECVARARACRSFILEAPTGWGKTLAGAVTIWAACRFALVVVDKADLMDHWAAELSRWLALPPSSIGRWRGQDPPPARCPVVVGMLQTLHKTSRFAYVADRYGTVIFDEVDRLGAPEFQKACYRLPAAFRAGFTATTRRADGREDVFEAHIGPVEVRATMPALRPMLFYVESRHKLHVRREEDEGGARVTKAEPTFGRTTWVDKRLYDDPERNALITRAALAVMSRRRHVVVFARTLEHLDDLYERAVAAGVPRRDVGRYKGGMSKTAREAASRCRLIYSTLKMGERGTNYPWWDACVLATPMADPTQPVGRVLREWPGKLPPVVVDVTDPDSGAWSGMFRGRQKRYSRLYGSEARRWII